jgi:hypothetical protein
MASIVIGAILAAVAGFRNESKGLLIGEGVDPKL